MAIIYSYPLKTTPLGKDLLVLTDSATKVKNATRSLTIDDLASYIVSNYPGSPINGLGTFNTIPLWTPDGKTLGDSPISWLPTNTPQPKLNIDTNVSIAGETAFQDDIFVSQALYDSSSNAGTSGQVLTSTGTQVEWIDPTDVVSGSVTTLVPYFQLATPGGSDTYTQSNNIVDFDWSGGSGTYEYILPSATAIPYRTIRFVNNSTITASDKIHITAPGTETIDGGAFYEINKPYNGCAVWSDGVQWIVIQAKA